MTNSPSSLPGSENFSDDELSKLLTRLKTEAEKRAARNRLANYRPYGKQRDFHLSGVSHRERLFMAGNQLGKTYSGAAEMAYHLTGRYPGWWEGYRFSGPIRAMAGSVSTELTRDGVQRLLIGNPEDESAWGTGMIPLDAIVGWNRRQGTANALDSVSVKHVNGGTSTLLFKAYEQGRAKWQANTIDLVWFDEEPPQDIYSEGITRTTATKGLVMMTFTPLLGMSEVVRRFLNETSPDRSVTTMTIYDVEHIAKEDVEREIAKYPEHERDARARGIPILGSGRIFPVAEERIVVDPIRIPDWWVRIGGLDFGWDHPFAAVEVVWDRDLDVVYVTREMRERQQTPAQHAMTLKTWGGIRFAWPHDGMQHDKGSGEQLAAQYRKHGLKMLAERATFADGTSGVEAGLFSMLERMQTGRFKVFSTCTKWLEEFRIYHREDGKVVKEFDDLISSSRYAIMMLRFARVPVDPRRDGSKSATAVGVGEVDW